MAHQEEENLCPICLEADDDETVEDERCGQCYGCGEPPLPRPRPLPLLPLPLPLLPLPLPLLNGFMRVAYKGQLFCGGCRKQIALSAATCPTCRAPFNVPAATQVDRMKSLVEKRSVGRHTPFVLLNLGAMYNSGTGFPTPNRAEAIRCWKAASDHGVSSCQGFAQFNLGLLFEHGTPPDLPQAVEWYTMAAGGGGGTAAAAAAAAASNLGALIERGGPGLVGPDPIAALQWYRYAAEGGDAHAQYNLGIACMEHRAQAVCKSADNADGVGENGSTKSTAEKLSPEAEAVRWFRAAAEQGHSDGAFNLGACYANGAGVNRNVTEAAHWLGKIPSVATSSYRESARGHWWVALSPPFRSRASRG